VVGVLAFVALKPSRLIAGMIAGSCGVGIGVWLLVWQGDAAFQRNGNNLKIILAVAFGIAYGLFWLADRLGLIADPYMKERNDVYEEKPEEARHEVR
jgi:hypothetical protein